MGWSLPGSLASFCFLQIAQVFWALFRQLRLSESILQQSLQFIYAWWYRGLDNLFRFRPFLKSLSFFLLPEFKGRYDSTCYPWWKFLSKRNLPHNSVLWIIFCYFLICLVFHDATKLLDSHHNLTIILCLTNLRIRLSWHIKSKV